MPPVRRVLFSLETEDLRVTVNAVAHGHDIRLIDD